MVLIIEQGDNNTRQLAIKKQDFIIGRGSTCDVTLLDKRISKHHVRLWWQPASALEEAGLTGYNPLKRPLKPNKRFKSLTPSRQKAISSAESLLAKVFENYSHAFHGSVVNRWAWMCGILVAMLLLILLFQKRKDII